MSRLFSKILSFTLCFQLLVSCNNYSTSSSFIGSMFSPSSGFSISGTIASSFNLATEALMGTALANTKIGEVTLSLLNADLEAEEIDRQDVFDDSMTFKFKNLNKEKIKDGVVLIQYISDDGQTRRGLIQAVDTGSVGEVVSVNPKTTFSSDLQSAILADLKNNSPTDFNLEKIQDSLSSFNLDEYTDVVDAIGGFDGYVDTFTDRQEAVNSAIIFLEKDYDRITDQMVKSPKSMAMNCKGESDISFSSKTKESRAYFNFIGRDDSTQKILDSFVDTVYGEAYTPAEAEDVLKKFKDRLLFLANYNGVSLQIDLNFTNKGTGVESKCPIVISPGDPIEANKTYFAEFNPDELKTADEAKERVEKIYNQTRDELIKQYSLAGYDEKSPALVQQLQKIEGWSKEASEKTLVSFSVKNRVQLDLSLFDTVDFPSYDSQDIAKKDIEIRFDKAYGSFSDSYNSYYPDQDFYESQMALLQSAYDLTAQKLEEYYRNLGPLKLNTTTIDEFDPSVYATEPEAQANAGKVLEKAYDDMKRLNSILQSPQEEWDAQVKIFETKKDEISTQIKEYFTKIAPLQPDYHQFSVIDFSTFETREEADQAIKSANQEIEATVKSNMEKWEITTESQYFLDMIQKLNEITHQYARISYDYFNLKLQPKVKEDFFLSLNFSNLTYEEALLNLGKAQEQTKNDWYTQAALCPNVTDESYKLYDKDFMGLSYYYKELLTKYYKEQSTNIKVDLSFIQNLDFSAIKDMDEASVLLGEAYAKAKEKLLIVYKNAGALNDQAFEIQTQLLVAERDKGLERAQQVLFDKGSLIQLNTAFLNELDFSDFYNFEEALKLIEEATVRTYEHLETQFLSSGRVNVEAYGAQKLKIEPLKAETIARAKLAIENHKPSADVSAIESIRFEGTNYEDFTINLNTAEGRAREKLRSDYELSGQVDPTNYEAQIAIIKEAWNSKLLQAQAYFGK